MYYCVGSGIQECSVWVVLAQAFSRCRVSCHPGQQPQGDLTGTGGRKSEMARSQGWQAGAGFLPHGPL